MNPSVARPLRTVVVGAGWAARRIWLPRLAAHPALTPVAVVDPDPGARDAVVGPGIDGFATVSGLPRGLADLAIVAVPNYLHAQVAEALLEAGVATFVEKPVCLAVAEADRLAAAEAAGGAPLLAGRAARHRHDVRRLLELARTVGRIRHVDLSWVRASGVPEGGGWFTDRSLSGGGALVDLGWHLLDVAGPLLPAARFCEVVGSVSDDFVNRSDARAAWRGDSAASAAGDVEDTARGFFVTQDGVSASLTASWASHRADDLTTVEVHGSTGTLRLACTFGYSANRNASVLTLDRRGITTAVPLQEESVGAEYDRLLDHVALRLADPEARGVAVTEARRHIDAVERLYASASSDRAAGAPAPGAAVLDEATRAVVFDLDGVLVDSFGVMRQAFAAAYREVVGEGEPPFEEYSRHLGRYFPDIMRIWTCRSIWRGPSSGRAPGSPAR